MKPILKTLLLIAGIIVGVAVAHIVSAQDEGTIIYETKVNMHRTLPPERAEMKETIPEFNSFRCRLAFKGEESYYTPIDDEEEDDFGEGGPVRVSIRRPQNSYYYDHLQGRSVFAREFFGKFFLIEDSIQMRPWKFSEEVKSVLGHSCRKATWVNEERQQTIIAWYAEKLKPFLGPEDFTGLPGTILQIDINDGERVITAEAIDFNKLKKGDLIIPSKGEKTTEADFHKMLQEHRKRAGGNIIIRN